MDVLNRTTRELKRSVNTPDFPIEKWIQNPDLSAVSGQPERYWLITGDSVTLMDGVERDAVDAALTGVSRDAEAGQLDDVDTVLRAFALVVLDEINALRSQHTLPNRTIAQLKVGVRNKLGS